MNKQPRKRIKVSSIFGSPWFYFGILLLFLMCFFLPSPEEDIKEKDVKVEAVPQEFQLLSCFIEIQNITNNFGGVVGTKKVFHYSFATDSGEVLFKEKTMHEHYYGTVYSLEFRLGDDNRILQYDGYTTRLIFIMTEEMYNQVFIQK